jgi:PAS domain-containing protein
MVVCDDHALFRQGVVEMLSVAGEGIEVVGEARTHEGAVAAVLEQRPDVVLLDLEMPGGMGGDEAMGRILGLSPPPGVVVYTMHDEPGMVRRFLSGGIPPTSPRMPGWASWWGPSGTPRGPTPCPAARRGPGRWPAGEGEMARLVREHDWATTPLGPIEAWPQHLRTLVDLVLASDVVMCLMWGERATMVYGGAYASAIGARHPEALGNSAFEIWADARPVFEPLFWRTWAGETAVKRDLYFFLARRAEPPEDAWFDLTYSPVRDERGEAAGVLAILTETTPRVLAERERAAAEAALQESETRYRAFVTVSSDVVYRMSPDWAEMRFLDGRGFISDAAEPTEGWMKRYIHPDDQPLVKAAIDEAVRTKNVFELEHRVRRVDGSLGWMLSRAVPILDARGEILEWLGTAADVTARKEGEAALRESEGRYRLAADAAGLGQWEFIYKPHNSAGTPPSTSTTTPRPIPISASRATWRPSTPKTARRSAARSPAPWRRAASTRSSTASRARAARRAGSSRAGASSTAEARPRTAWWA